MPPVWYSEGLRFGCAGCGDCCRTHGEYAYIYLNDLDVAAIAGALGLGEEAFVERYCIVDGPQVYFKTLDSDCDFLGPGGRCQIYPVRPRQCATWPFWTENLDRETWEGPVSACCPGVGQGPLHSLEEIHRLAKERDEWYGYSWDSDEAPPQPE